MKGNHHHLEAKKFLFDMVKRKDYAGSVFLTARTLSILSSPLKLNGE
jgi:hypothetical protein